jgi:hypothetical protein
MTCSTVESEVFNRSAILHIVSPLLTEMTRAAGDSDGFGLGTINAGETDVFDGSVKSGLLDFFAVNFGWIVAATKKFC